VRTLIITENVSLDGVIAPMDGWFDPTLVDEDLLAVGVEHREAADALVVGRVTYEEFAGFWPAQRDDPTGTARYLDRVAKYVVSSRELSAGWANTTRLRGPMADELAALKRQPGADIVVTGSATLVTALVPSGLVDRYRLFVYPVVQGRGRRLFPDGARADLDLVATRGFASGVVLLEYSVRA
jgi:dihydrofolate reductase